MKAVINIKADTEVKEKAKETAKELGLSLSAIINAYLKQFVRTQEVYFTTSPRISPELEKLLGRVERDIKRSRNISRTLSSPKDLKEYLDAL